MAQSQRLMMKGFFFFFFFDVEARHIHIPWGENKYLFFTLNNSRQAHAFWYVINYSFSTSSTVRNFSCCNKMTEVASNPKGDPAYEDEERTSSTAKLKGRQPSCHESYRSPAVELT